VERGETLELAHPFIRDLVESAIPAVARRELYARALELASQAGAALELRAEHAYRGAELHVALPLLREAGAAALRRGDPHAAGVAYQRALELLRRAAFVSADESTWQAMAEVSRELAGALAARGDLMGADGVLREGLEFCHARDDARAQLLVDLADVLHRRQRSRDAARVVVQALEIAKGRADKRCQARAHVVAAALRKSESDAAGALAALTSAHALLCESEAPSAELAALTVDLATAMLASGDASGALLAVASAESLADAGSAPALAARCKILRAQAAQSCGQRDPALALYDEALPLAGDAGDPELVLRIQLAREQCARMPARKSLRTGS
jgi:tetratricopeptide (TPR) repeat protein